MQKRLILLCAFLLLPCACRSTIIKRSDREVYSLVEQRQRDALGATSNVRLQPEDGHQSLSQEAYSFTPRPVDNSIPPEFQNPAATREVDEDADHHGNETPAADAAVAGDADKADDEVFPSIFSPQEKEEVVVFGLREALAYAMRSGRDLQDAREDLYLQALNLTLERHLWTPQFVANATVDADFSDAGDLHDSARAITATADVGLTQRLPYGGQVTARVLQTLVRDLETHVTSAETGSVILEAGVPLLRGAGRTAYESRYSAERELIYAVRRFERFRRSYLVDVAARYFDLQRSKAAIINAFKSYKSLKEDWERAEFINKMGQSKTVFDAPRAKASFRSAEATLVRDKEQHATALDRFKIFLGMPVGKKLDVLDQDADEQSRRVDLLLPHLAVAAAVEVALRSRLDLLTQADRVDDSQRAVEVARNRVLPDLDFAGSIAIDSDPERANSASFNTERNTWNTGLSFRMDDRKTERNAYRAALVALRRAQRDFEEFVDTVRADVRRAHRRILQQDNLRKIQALNVEENELRYAAARAQFDLGKSTNQDVVDADENLLEARNQLAAAVAEYRNAILAFRLDTGTIRVLDDGTWDSGAATTGAPVN